RSGPGGPRPFPGQSPLPIHGRADGKVRKGREQMSETLWRGYDKAALDRQINLRARTPEHVEFFARWAEEGRRVRARLDCRLDLPYGSQPMQTLDFFPAGASDAPLVAFIHGGYWQSLDKADFSYLAPAFVDAGIAYAS